MNSASRYITKVKVKDIEKRRYPSKYYTYITEVTWNNGNEETIARQYGQFFDLHCTIIDEFPTESGIKGAKKRIIPFLPGKVFFVTENKARKRIQPINDYCTKLIELPSFISQSETILHFFEQNAEDKLPSKLNQDANSNKVLKETPAKEISGPVDLEQFIVLANFDKATRKELSLKAGEVVGLIEKSNTGWWLVTNENKNNGWVPAAYLESLSEEQTEINNNAPKRVEAGNGEWYVAVHTVSTVESDEELAFFVGEKLEVLEQNLDGWWFAVSKTGKQGWVPGSYLEKLHSGKNASAEETNRLSKRKMFKRAAPKRGTVRQTIRMEDRVKAKQMIREKMKMQLSNEKELLQEYETTTDFDQNIEGGINFKANQTVMVLEKSNSGWWYCKIGHIKGWISEEYLKPKTVSAGNENEYSSIDDKEKPPFPTRPKVNISPQRDRPPPITKTALPPPPIPAPPRKAVTKQTLLKPKPTLLSQNKPPQVPKHNFQSSPKKTNTAFPGKFEQNNNTAQSHADPRKPPGNIFQKFDKKPSTNLLDFPWFKDISRQRAELLLKEERKEGFFIMRKSKDYSPHQPYSMTLFHNDKIWNFRIRARGDGQWAVGLEQSQKNTFQSLPELVEFYSTNHLLIGDEMVLFTGTPLGD